MTCPPPTLQNRWVRLFTDNEPVIQATLALLPVFSVALMADGVNVALQALLRGAGKQKVQGERGGAAVRSVGAGAAVQHRQTVLATSGSAALQGHYKATRGWGPLPPSLQTIPCITLSAPQTGALSNILCYWLLAIPLAHQLAFAGGWGLQGLWTGIAAANVLQAGRMHAAAGH